MRELGFVPGPGRHWEYSFEDGEIVALEFASPPLFPEGIAEPVVFEVMEGHSVVLLDPEALLIDRLTQRLSGDVTERELDHLFAGLGSDTFVSRESLLEKCGRMEERGAAYRGLSLEARGMIKRAHQDPDVAGSSDAE